MQARQPMVPKEEAPGQVAWAPVLDSGAKARIQAVAAAEESPSA